MELWGNASYFHVMFLISSFFHLNGKLNFQLYVFDFPSCFIRIFKDR